MYSANKNALVARKPFLPRRLDIVNFDFAVLDARAVGRLVSTERPYTAPRSILPATTAAAATATDDAVPSRCPYLQMQPPTIRRVDTTFQTTRTLTADSYADEEDLKAGIK